MSSSRNTMPKLVICFIGMTMASAAMAQAPRSSVEVGASTGAPEFRDPKTGQVWTPDNVGLVSGPNTPADRAFDPLAQSVRVEGTVVQRPKIIPLGAVPTLVGGRIGKLVTGFINLSVAFPTLLVAIFVAAIIGVGARGAVAGDVDVHRAVLDQSPGDRGLS